MKFKDLTGQKFGNLIVIQKGGTHKGHIYWLCLCTLCGRTKEICGCNLRANKSNSCGCSKMRHGQAHSHLHYIWAGMKQRCYNPNNKAYKNYGGRGIRICEEWHEFKNFLKWATETGYYDNNERKCTIERIDVNENYCPENCKWISIEDQWKNTREERQRIKYDGKEWLISELCKKYKVPYSTLKSRIDRNWDIEKALFTPKLR